jgi:hydrogenase expression/formation protein HypD
MRRRDERLSVSSGVDFSILFDGFRDKETIFALRHKITEDAKKLKEKLYIMEVCGGHTHTIMKYGINQMMPDNIEFVHGPGCPVCIMPKGRIDAAIALAGMEDTILVTLGDMIRVPGSSKSLSQVRGEGADVRFVYSPTEILKIASENPNKKVIYFAIGFETTTPMTAALMDRAIKNGLTNIFYAINHVTVPEPMCAIMDDPETKVNAFLAPAHVSVITGSKIYEPISEKYGVPIVAAGFEPVDIMHSISMLVMQKLEGRAQTEIEYTRSVGVEANPKAMELINKYMEVDDFFIWRGIGAIPKSSLRIREEFAHLDAYKVFADVLPKESAEDHKACICGEVLKGKAKPYDCKVFGKACTPSSPLGSCMVSSEGACAAYFKYGKSI